MISIRTPNLSQTIAAIHKQDMRIQQATTVAIKQSAHDLRGIIVRGLRDQIPGGDSILPLARTTILMRGLPKRRTYNPQRAKGGAVRQSRLKSGARRVRVNRDPIVRSKGKRPKLGKGSTKALINSGDMLRSIHVRGGMLHYTVGIHRGARNKKGNDLVNIASIHEYGTKRYTMTVNGHMARFSRFLVMMGILNVPWKIGQTLRRKGKARPFIRPGKQLWERDASELFAARIAKAGGLVTG